MGPDEARRLAGVVKGLYPQTSGEVVALLTERFTQFEVGVVEAELAQFRSRYEELHVANLLRRISEQQERRTPRRGDGEERRRLEAERRREEATLAKLTPAEWKAAKDEILKAHPHLRAFLGNKDPCESVTMRAMIFEARGKAG